jgi:hypothetical protein
MQELVKIVLYVLGGHPIWYSESTRFVSQGSRPGFFSSQNI